MPDEAGADVRIKEVALLVARMMIPLAEYLAKGMSPDNVHQHVMAVHAAALVVTKYTTQCMVAAFTNTGLLEQAADTAEAVAETMAKLTTPDSNA